MGPTYQARSYAVSADRLVNWYPEIVESGLGKTKVNYYPTPGLALHADTSALKGITGGRGAFALDGRQWSVIGENLVEFKADGTFKAYPGLGDDGNPAYIVANANTPPQLMVSSNEKAWIFDTGADTLARITGGDPPAGMGGGAFFGCAMPGFLDDYLLSLTPDSRQFQISQPGDGMTWAAIDVSANLGSADKLKAMITDHEYVYFFGSKRAAVYANSGAGGFPIVPVPGAFIEAGIRAPATLKRYNDSLIWYGENEDGRGSVYIASGFIPTRVSTHATEQAWCKYSRDDDAIGRVQVRDGHPQYIITFPTGDQTWCFDLATKMWHERASWDVANGVFHAQIQRFGCYSNGVYYVVGTDGKIYREQNQTYTENGAPIRRLRIGPVVANQNKMMFVSRLELVIQPGVGLDGDPAAQGANPLIMLRYSGDSGRTWSNVITASAGLHGDADTVVSFDQLGSGRAWVPEISVTDPNNFVLVTANIDVTAGTN